MSSSGASEQRVLDPREKQVGTIYARGLIGATEKTGQTEAVLEEFGSFVADVLDKNPKLDAVLASALVKSNQKAELVDRVLGQKASKTFLNFLKVVARHGRLESLRSILAAAREIRNELRGIVPVYVSTAAPTNNGALDGVAGALAGLVQGKPEIQHQVDPSLIGGLVVRVGDTVFDGSIATQLEHVRRQMINRSVHEIQSRRDRFRHSDGN